MSGVTNVIKMLDKPTTAKALSLVLPFDTLERTREALNILEVTVALAQKVLDKAEEHGHKAALAGVRDVFQAANVLIV